MYNNVDFYVFSKEECKEQIDTAKSMIENAENYLNSKLEED